MKRLSGFLISRILTVLLLSIYVLVSIPMPVMAAGAFGSSKIATGTRALFEDVTRWLLILAPIVGGLLVIYFFIRRSAADEMDQSAATRCRI